MYKGILMSFFERDFLSVILDIEEEYRGEILKNSPYLFRKWYSSTLKDDMGYSPFTLITQKYRGSKDEIMVPTFHINREDKNSPIFNIEFNFVSNENHIIIEDFKKVIVAFEEGIFIDKNDELLMEAKNRLVKEVSKEEDFYVSYLLMIAYNIELIKNEHTVFGDMLKASDDYLDFFDMDSEDILKKLFYSALSVSSYNIFDSDSQDLQKLLFSIIKNHTDANHLIKSIAFNKSKDVFNYFDGLENGTIEEKNTDLLIEIYKYSILADKWFFTPFGSYFYFLEPRNTKKYNIISDINAMYSRITLKRPLTPSLYQLYTSFTLTKLGKSFFKSYKSYLSFQDLIPPEKLNEVVADILDERAKLREIRNEIYDENETVYVLKVFETKTSDNVSIIQISERNSLGEFILFLNMLFKNDTFIPKSCSVGNTNYINLTAKLGDLLEGDTLTLSFKNRFDKKEEFTASFSELSEKKKNLIYPRILSVSKTEKEQAV